MHRRQGRSFTKSEDKELDVGHPSGRKWPPEEGLRLEIWSHPPNPAMLRTID